MCIRDSYYRLANLLKSEPVDAIYNAIVELNQLLNLWLSKSQTGRLRWYLASMVAGLIILISLASNLGPGVLQW